MKVIVAGSRTVDSYETVEKAILESGFEISEIVSGAAKGVDTLGERFAKEHGIALKQFHADWDKYGKGAGPVRNTEMGRYADALVAVSENNSRGTFHMVSFMKSIGKPVFLVELP